MTTKKTLIVKHHLDVTEMDDETLEAYKTMLRFAIKKIKASNDIPQCQKIDFEVLVENQEDSVQRMLHAVRREFMACDEDKEIVHDEE